MRGRLRLSGGSGGSPAAALEPGLAQPEPPIRIRSYWNQVWLRFRADRLAVVSAFFLAFVVLACFAGGPILERVLGHGPNTIFPYGASENLTPVGPWSWVPDTQSGATPGPDTPKTLLILGADSSLGRDELLRLLAGGRVSLEIGFLSALIAILIGLTLGATAGFYGGWVDSLISRTTEFVMSFPLLLFLIALGDAISDRFDFITLAGAFEPGVLSLAVVFGLFTWFYPARVIRTIVIQLREQEFVEAARMIGASDARIIRTHLLPHLVAPLLIWGSFVAATNIVLEAAISFLNLGIHLPTASWGNMLSTNWGTLLAFDPAEVYRVNSAWTMIWPSATVLLTVLALTLVGEGLRTAFDPKAEG